jgi:hypothetical protein
MPAPGLALLEVTNVEREAEALGAETLARATALVRGAGYVLLTGALSADWCERMRTGWERQQAPGQGAHLRWELPIMDRLAVENPWGLQVLAAIMGADIWGNSPYHTNTLAPDHNWIDVNGVSAPGDAHVQVVHRDAAAPLIALAPGALPPPPAAMILHILLVDFTEENGGTELWPGTHLVRDDFEREMSAVNPPGYSADHAEARAATVPSVRMHAPRGTIVVRDMRMWHRARHNRTARPRVMLSLVYHAPSVDASTRPAEQVMPQATAARLSDRGRCLYRANVAPKL